MASTLPSNPVLIINEAMTANAKLVSGPATPTRAAPISPHLTLFGLKGTGLAARNGTWKRRYDTTGSSMVVNGSICRSGLSDIRPASSAVVSPSHLAVKACIISCRTIENTRENNSTTISPVDRPLNIPLSIAKNIPELSRLTIREKTGKITL